MTVQDIQKLKEYRSKIIEVLLGNVDQSVLQSYSYSDSDGTQSKHNRSPKELTALLEQVENLIDMAEAGNGSGIRTFSTNRYARGGI